jgi:AraC-like DNA-binding protein
MADFCNLSEGYFSHHFKESVGIAPIKYLTNLRMEKAKFLLSESDLSVSAIAWSLGYGDLLYFSRIFKKIVGESPTIYRKRFNEP